ncbi:histidine decarboxylase [Salmo salar]|uniref:Histidine decarboxylase n=1 Tax=Salmo salar TaxID=8030 RepID=A0ABM3CGC3_SALSA|nr:histidine decarboxylase [Salmo salar]
MQAEEYNRRGKEMVDYITRYLTTIRERKVTPGPEVKPGYMRELLPDSAPTDPEDWDCIFRDIEKVIMPGVVHWQSPYMHAYYPALTSWPSMLGDMLADAINNIGFTWASSPACTELEMNVMDWLCKALGLPTFFLHHHPDSTGGGILQSTVSESSLVALLAARKARIQQQKRTDPADRDLDDSVVNSRLVAYASDQAHSSVEKAGLISLVKIRFLPPDDHFSLRGDTLKQAIQEDRRRGLVPVMLCATLGTTGVCAFDDLSELGPVCAEEGLWLHVDAAYAGSAFLCPELRGPLGGIEYADSFAFNPSKWMMVHFDCTAFWVKDKYKLQQTFSVDPVYLRHENSDQATDFMHWQIPLSRRFRSLKLWFVMRSFGLKNLQGHIRHGVEMAKLLESLVRCDPNFDMPAERHLGLVVFCLKEGNALTQELLRRLTRSGTMYLVPADIDRKRIIRFTVTSQLTTSEDIIRDWNIIRKMAADLLAEDAEKQAVSKMEEQQSPVRKTVEKLSETNSDSENHTTTAAEGLAASLMTRKPKEIEKAISHTEDETLKTPKKQETGPTQTSPKTGSKELEAGQTQTSPKTGSKELEAGQTQTSPKTGSKELEAGQTQTSPKTGSKELEAGQTQTSPKTGSKELEAGQTQTSPKTGSKELEAGQTQTSPKTGSKELEAGQTQTSPNTGSKELEASPKTGLRELVTSQAQTSQDPETGARDGPKEIPCTAAFRVQRVQPQLRLDSDKTGFRPQPPFWMDKEKSGSENRPRRTVRSLSCSSEPLPGPIGPLFSHNTDPLSKPLSSSVTDSQPGHKDPDLIHPLNDTQLRRLSSGPSPSGLFQIPEWPSPTNSNQLGKRVLRKLTKFYSLPSFCHLWVQCGHYQVCCPVRGLQIAPKLRSPQIPGPPLGVGDSAVGLVPL